MPDIEAAVPADIIGEPHSGGGYAATGVIEIVRYESIQDISIPERKQ